MNHLEASCLAEPIKSNLTLRESLENQQLPQNISKTGLSEMEARLVLSYSGQASSWINSDLRKKGENTNTCKRAAEQILIKALRFLPKSNNQVVYRKDRPHYKRKVVFDWFSHHFGRIVKFPNFLSSSMENYWGYEHIIFKIQTAGLSKGHSLESLQVNWNEIEKEVLFESGSIFKIINVNEKIELRELAGDYDDSILMTSNIYSTP